MTILLHEEHIPKWYKKLNKRLLFLGNAMTILMREAWDARRAEDTGPLDNFFGSGIIGYVDSFPIYVRRPSKRQWQSALYQGKYHAWVVKIQGVCNVRGRPIFCSGPHAGTSADINLWRDFGPALTGDEVVLGDKAYRSKDVETVIAPFKKKKNAALTQQQLDYNIVHSWYRSTVEHCFAQYKRFQVLAGVYRGHLHKDKGQLAAIVSIISGILVLQIGFSPLRRSLRLLDDDDDRAIAAEADVRRADDAKQPRSFVDGLPLGDDKKDIVADPFGDIAGPGVEPDDAAVDSGHQLGDFAVGDRILAYWWGLWWYSRVQYVAVRSATLTIKWDWSGNTIKGWPPRLCHKLR